MKLVFDIEADNLLPNLTKFHCFGAIDVDTGAEYWFRSNQLQEFLDLLDSAEIIIAHNAFGYDVPALTKLTGWKPKATVQCTKVMSQVLKYNRFGFGHSLKKWGEFFRDEKGDYTRGFETFNEDMFNYMKQDVRLLRKVYNYLVNELKHYIKLSGSKNILKALRLEMELDAIMVEQCQNGWKFDKEGAIALTKTIDVKMKKIENFVNPLLPGKASVVDPNTIGAYKSSINKEDLHHIPLLIEEITRLSKEDIQEKEPTTNKRYAVEKKPTYTKTGKLVSHVQRWFGLSDGINIDTSPVWGVYCRVEFSVGDIGNTDTVKRYLESIGWEPDEWNWKRSKEGELKKVSAKLSDSSLEPLGEVGQALMEYYTLRSRKSILEGWFPYIDENSRLHGDVFNIGTPTFRQTHKIIANLPGAYATLGHEFRSLFIAEEGYTLVSADSAACQLRLLAYYMNDPKFTDTVLNGDVHQMNADILDCTRPQAKRFIFAYLYGAGAQKLSGYIDKTVPQAKTAMNRYKKSLPALAALIDKVNSMIETQGFIPGLDDRKIMLDPKERHKALNYLIQGAEAVVMKATVAMIDKELKAANIDFKHVLFYHDEHTVEVRKDQAEQAKEIIMRCFEEAPKRFGVDIMTCGDCNIGDDYYQVH
jgi:DNA polymerase I-like protein with 3'-5' exonuclease and polymerase domains